MDLVNKIFDLPVIVQGALGSFLFWALFELGKRTVGYLSNAIGHYNNKWRMEALILERLQCLGMLSTNPVSTTNLLTVCLYSGLARVTQGLIYLCFGLITQSLLGPMALVAYGFSVVYLYRGYAAVAVEFGTKKDTAFYTKRISEIDEKLKELGHPVS